MIAADTRHIHITGVSILIFPTTLVGLSNATVAMEVATRFENGALLFFTNRADTGVPWTGPEGQRSTLLTLEVGFVPRLRHETGFIMIYIETQDRFHHEIETQARFHHEIETQDRFHPEMRFTLEAV